MARRRIGQEAFGFAAGQSKETWLDEMLGLIAWAPIEAALRDVYAAPTGEKAWPPLALFRGLLLGTWHDVSDARLAEAIADRMSFRRFCGFSMTEGTPERTAFVRFRAELVRRGLEKRLFAAVLAQLEAKGLMVKTGTLVDATVVAAASKKDDEAGWNAYARGGPVKGYKAHVATDEKGNLVRRVAVTPANVVDAKGLVLPRRPGRVWADAGYDHRAVRDRIRAAGGTERVARRLNKRSRPEVNAAKRAWNAAIHPVRCSIEKVFGTAKRSYGLRRARYLGLARTSLQVHLVALAYNLRRAAALLRPQHA